MSPAPYLMNQRKDGYEPSDTETEWQESPWNDPKKKKLVLDYNNRRTDSAVAKKFSTVANVSPPGFRRNNGKTPHRPAKDDSVLVMLQRNISPLSRAERRRHESPIKIGTEEIGSSSTRTRKEENKLTYSHGGSNRKSQKPSYNRRSATAPRLRMRDEHMNAVNDLSQRRERAAPLLQVNSFLQQPKEVSQVNSLSVGEMNEMIADGRICKGSAANEPVVESTGSISPGDIFFSRDGLPVGINNGTAKRNAFKNYLSPQPKFVSRKNDDTYNQVEVNANGGGVSSAGAGLSTTTTNSAAVSRESSSRISTESSKMSDVSGRTSESTRRFIANRRKKKNDIWLSCMRKGGTCRITKSPEKEAFDEASFIEKAIVVEYLKPFWADQHRPVSLNGFTFHKHEAQLLKQSVSVFLVGLIL